jgi:hypothetical protein
MGLVVSRIVRSTYMRMNCETMGNGLWDKFKLKLF